LGEKAYCGRRGGEEEEEAKGAEGVEFNERGIS
jgi:hypothetical protein